MSFISLLKHPDVHCNQIFCGEIPTQTCIQNFKDEICKCCAKDEKESKYKACLKICNPNISANVNVESYDKTRMYSEWKKDFRRPHSQVLFTPDPDPRLEWILYGLLACLVSLVVAVIVYRRLFRVV